MEGTSQKGSLPAGWIVKFSNKYQNRVYYFNIYTGCTTWDCPTLDAPKKSEKEIEKHTSILNKEALGASTSAQQVKRLSKLSHKDISSSVKRPPHSKLIEICSVERKEKRSLEKNHISSASSEVSQHFNAPTAIVTPVILKSKNKSSTQDSPSASTATISQSKNMNSIAHFKRTSADPLGKRPLSIETPAASVNKPISLKRSAASFERPCASKRLAASLKGPAASLEKPSASLEKPSACLKRPSIYVEIPTASLERSAASVESLHSMISDIRAKSSTPIAGTKCKTTVNDVKRLLTASSHAKITEVQIQSVQKKKKKKRPRKRKSNISDVQNTLSVPIPKIGVSSSVSNSSSQNLENVKPSCVTQSADHKSTVLEPSPHRNGTSPLNNSNAEKKFKDKLEIRAERFGLNNGPKVSTETLPCTAIASSSSHESDQDSEMDFELEAAPETTGVDRAESSDSDSLDDIEMLDVSSELPNIAKMVPAAPRFGNSILESFYLVVDTNVLISDLKHLEDMKETPVNRCGPPHVYIPWIVLQELDYLKKSTKANRCKAAKDAIRYINSLLKAKHPRYHVQTPEEAKECSKDFSRNNDDKLLECCYFLHQHMPREKVILLTNDKNLSNKAMGCNILVHDCASLSKFLKPDVLKREDVIPTLDPRSDSFETICRMKNKEQKLKKDIKSYRVGTPLENQTDIQNCRMEIDRLMTDARRILTDVLDPVFEKEMDEAYGDAWHFFPVERHTLKGILNGFIKYWRTVFEFIFLKKDKSNFELLQQKVNRPEGFLGERQECLDILSAMEDISNLVKSKRSPVSVERIKQLRISVEEAFSKLSASEQSIDEIERNSEGTETECVLEVFQHNWSVINHVCGSVLDFCKKPHEFVYDRSGELLSKSDYLRIVPELMRSLTQLKEHMEKTMEVVETGKSNNQLFKDFFQVLQELVPILHIPTAHNPDFYNFSPKMLERFCRSPKNSLLFKSGYQQLVNFHTNLNSALLCLLYDMKTL